MNISIDGGITYVQANDVRIAFEEVPLPGEDEAGELHLSITEDGVVMDVWLDEENPGTSSETVGEIAARLCEANL